MQGVNKLSDYTKIVVIGKGTYAKVSLSRKKSTGVLYAIKAVKKKYIEMRHQSARIMIEKQILTEIQNEFLIKIHCSFQDEAKLYFVLEYCPGGQLFGLLTKKRKLTEEQAKFYAAQIMIALEYLHSKNIIYRDLKPQNILICANGYIKLTDFGLSKINVVAQKEAFTICGTPQYLAPEVLRKEGHGKAVDWWCFGSVIYELVHGMPPFYKRNRGELFESIKNENPYFSKLWSPQLRSLLSLLLEKNAEARLKNVQSLRQHPWFATINWNDLYEHKIVPPFKPTFSHEGDIQYFDKEFTTSELESCGNSIGEGNNFEGFSFEQRSPNQNMIIEQKLKGQGDQPQYEMMETEI